jgi:hypothetical protein
MTTNSRSSIGQHNFGPTKSQELAALLAKNALVSLGLLIVFLILAWPSVLLFLLYFYYCKKYDYDVSSSILSESSAAVTVVTVIIISTTHVHLKLLVSHPSYLCFNRRIFLFLRIPLPPLLMLIYRSEMLREGGSTWYRDTLSDAQDVLQKLSSVERERLRQKLLSTINNGNNKNDIIAARTSIYQEITTLFLQNIPKYARRDLIKKLRNHYIPRNLTSKSVLGERELSIDDLYLLYRGEARKVRSDLDKRWRSKMTTKKDSVDNSSSKDNNSIEEEDATKESSSRRKRSNTQTQLMIVDQFIQRALILFLCPNAIIDRYHDSNGTYCAMTFSYRLENSEDNDIASATAASATTTTATNNKPGGVHLSIGYFALESESNSGIWHYNFLRTMLRGFISGLCHELQVYDDDAPTSSSSASSTFNKTIRYVNMGTHEDYVKHSCGAVGANLWEHPEVIKRVCPVGLFKENGSVDDELGWLSLKPEI